MVETDVLARILGVLQDEEKNVHHTRSIWIAIEAIAALVKFGRLIYDISFYTVQILMFQQMFSAPRWWKQMSLLILFVCFKMRINTYISHLLKLLLPSQNLVG
jgi:hypothetical protein